MPTSLSPQVLESYRKQGRSDMDIANEFSSDKDFATQYKKVKTRYGENPDAVSAFMNLRFYGDVNYKPKEQGFIGRSLDKIYENYEKDKSDIKNAWSQWNQGNQRFADTLVQTVANVGSIGLSPVTKPLGEAVVGVGKAAYDYIPGVKPTVDDVISSRLVQEGIKPTAESIAIWVSEQAKKHPEVQSLLDAGELGLDALDVYAVGQGLKAVKPVASSIAENAVPFAKSVGKTAVELPGNIPYYAGKLANKTIVEPTKSFVRGAMGGVDDIATKSPLIQKTALVGKAKEAVDLGLGEDVVRFAIEQNPETRAAISRMTVAAAKESGQLGGSVAHKELLGGEIMNNLIHILEQKETVGKALGSMKQTMAREVVDATDQFDDLMSILRNKGAVFNDKGRIVSFTAAADDNVPLLNQALDFLRPGSDGKTLKLFKEVDDWRSKMFEEIGAAKARLQPSSGGSSSMDFSEKTIDTMRSKLFNKAAGANDRLIAYNRAFEELSRESKSYLKSIGYKGRLRPEDITAKALKAGEVSQRILGNASADTRGALKSIISMAKKYGYNSNIDVYSLVRWSDALEDLFPITPTRSLQGGVSRATKDATGRVVEDVLSKGATRTVTGVANEWVMKTLDTFRGLTPENRLKVLLELLDAPEGTSFLKVLDDALPKNIYDDIVKKDIENLKASDVKSAIDDVKTQGKQSQGTQSALSTTDDLSSVGKSVGEEIQPSPVTVPQETSPVKGVERVMDRMDKKLGMVDEKLKINSDIKLMIDNFIKDKKAMLSVDPDFVKGKALGEMARRLDAKGAFKYRGGASTIDSQALGQAIDEAIAYHEGKPIVKELQATRKALEGGTYENVENANSIYEGFQYGLNPERKLSKVDTFKEMIDSNYEGLTKDTVLDNQGNTAQNYLDEAYRSISSAAEKRALTRAKNAARNGAEGGDTTRSGGDRAGGVGISTKIAGIPDKLQGLAQEAKKYKSAEDFSSAIKEKANKVFQLSGNDIEEISIVGSTARGKVNPNDLDILITPKKMDALTPENLATRRDMSRILENELQEFFPDTKIQVVIAKYDSSRGPKSQLTDLWNKVHSPSK